MGARTISPLTIACMAFVLGACGGGERRVAVDADFPAAACATSPGRGPVGGVRYARTAAFGEAEADTLLSVAGVAVGGGRVYVLDGAAGTVRVLDDSLRSVATIGRPGKGPGEFDRFTMPTSHGGSHRWISVQGDTLAVFDGERVSRFGLDGTLLSTWSYDRVRGASPMQSRIAQVAGEVMFSTGGYDVLAGGRQTDFEVHATRGARPVRVAGIALPPVSSAMTSEHARPRWDVHGRCIVLSDGTSPWLVRVDRETGAVDTLPLRLPDRDPPPISEEERRAARMAGARGGLPEPAAPLRVRDLVMGPDGEVWIRPVQPTPAVEGIEVLRISPATGAVRTDTVPAFPRAFGAPGVFYTVEATTEGVPVVVRYAARR